MPDPHRDLKDSLGLPAITCAVAGLILPLAQIPALLFLPFLGQAALFVIPAAIFGALLAFGVAQGSPERARITMRFTALGFGLGAFAAAHLLGPRAEPGFLSGLIAGGLGGLALSLGCVGETRARLLITAATALSFALVALIGFGGSSSGCGG